VKCHPDAPLAIMQHNYAKIHGYAKGSSFWRAPYRRATHLRKNIYPCKQSVILMHPLRSCNTMMQKYIAMPRAHHFEGHLTGGQHIYERIYTYASEVSSWCTPYN
jgi:hypothetical protein